MNLQQLLWDLKGVLIRLLPKIQVEIPQTPSVPSTPTQPASPIYLWDNFANAQHSVRVICDEEGLSVSDKNILSACVRIESNYNPLAIHKNISGGKVVSTDFGIAQINDFFHIGNGKDFPSSQFVLQNPETDIRWMCKMWLAGKQSLWVSFSKGLYKRYL